MEKDLRIKLPDGHGLYGRFDGTFDQPLFIMIHGLPGNTQEYFYKAATNWFAKKDFATFRFNLYDWHLDARQLIDCTLATHAADLDAVVRYFRRKGSKKIFVAGHSFGGPTILFSKAQKFDAAALWDPSYDLSFTKEKYGFPGGTYIKALNGYYMNWGVNVVLGKAMAEEVDTTPWDALTKNFHVPLKIFAAEKGVLVKGAEAYFANAHEPKELAIVKNATHYFEDEDGMEERLFRDTKKWFDRFVK